MRLRDVLIFFWMSKWNILRHCLETGNLHVLCFFLVMPICRLQGLGHAILGNFSTDEIVIKLT